MTAVTSDAVVQIPADIAMLVIHRRAIVRVTIQAAEYRIVR